MMPKVLFKKTKTYDDDFLSGVPPPLQSTEPEEAERDRQAVG